MFTSLMVAAAVAPGLPAPELARTANAELVSGFVCVQVPRSARCEPLTAPRQVPFGSTFNAVRGHVRITTADGVYYGGTQSSVFWAGGFYLTQARSGLVGLALRGGVLRNCPVARPGTARAAAVRRVRKLWGNGRGRFRTRGRFGAAAVRGTRWLTYDRCDGTYFATTSGRVLVEDFTRNRRVTLTAGRNYTAPPTR